MPLFPHSSPISAAEDGQRLDQVLAARLACSRGFAHRMIKNGLVLVNQRPVAKGSQVRRGDILWIDPVVGAAGDVVQPEPEGPLSVRYEDEHLVVLDKPAGQPSHPLAPAERGTLTAALLSRYPEMANIGYSAREPGLVHRLDVHTSGLLVAARTPACFERLRRDLQGGRFDKHYVALAQGRPQPGSYRAYLTATGPRVRVHRSADSGGAPIHTEILTTRPGTTHALVRVAAHLAKRHQIRAHLADIGHPLYGDTRYEGCDSFDDKGHALHAIWLAFEHPMTGSAIECESPMPARFVQCCGQVGIPAGQESTP